MLALITRPREDAEGVAHLLQEQGLDTLVEPMMAVRLLAEGPLDLSEVRALLVTSANGVRAFVRASEERTLPVYAVGDATARAARQAGFAHVTSAGGDVASLAELVRTRVKPGPAPLLHVAGTVVAGDLAARLAGYTVRREVLYEARPVQALSDHAATALDQGAVDLALFYSPRTAATFSQVVADRADTLRRVTAYALSQGVASQLSPLPFHRIRVAEAPDQASLLAVITRDLERV